MEAEAPSDGLGLAGARPVCPVVVGRARELAVVTHLLAEARAGRGATTVVRGEAGIGKTRLVQEVTTAAAGAAMTVLVGRGVQHGSSPYRPLTEALFAVSRSGSFPDTPALRPFRHALGTVVPDWRTDGVATEASPVVVAEGVLRLVRDVGAGTGTLLVVEDLHWADPDTLAVLEYLADNVGAEPALVLLTSREDRGGGASDLVGRLQARRAALVVDLPRLSPADMATMAAACAGAAGRPVPDDVLAAVAARADGLPLLVEELLSVPATGVAVAVPDSVAGAVARRLAALPARSLLVVQCAAVLGRRFDWRLLGSVTGLSDDDVRTGLEDAVAVQLVDAEAGGTFRFHHALTRDAVVAGMLPPTRAALARRAAAALAATDDDATVALVADLWCAAGDPAAAASHLLAGGRRALAGGALVTAERLLTRAHELAVDDALRTETAEALTEAHALAARLQAASAVGAEALDRLAAAGGPPGRQARIHLVLARAADAATQWALAGAHLGTAAQLAADAGDDRLLAHVDALAAHVAMGEHRHGEAELLAVRAAAAGARLGLPEVECEALEVIGRRERLRDLGRASAAFEQAHAIARRHGLVLWQIRTLHELGTIDMFRSCSPGRLHQASDLATRAGALSVAATVDLQLAGLHAFRFELDEALDAAGRALDVSQALALSDVHVVTLLQVAFVHAIAGRPDEMESSVGAALAEAGDRPEAAALAWGHARATYALLEEDRPRAMEQLELALGSARRAPGVPGVFAPLWALLRVVEGAGREVLDELDQLDIPAIPMSRAIAELAEAVLLGRSGDRAGAEAVADAADRTLREQGTAGFRHLSRRLAAEAAIADGWGDPVRWLRDAMASFEASGHDRVAAACRDLLRRAGRPVPRGPAPGLPERLTGAGVTSREADVLRLVGDRLTNREIAERLYVSHRTVEKHVERLLAKTAAADRAALGRLAREVYGPAPP